MLTGKYLVNLDSEDEGEIFIGCAGGIDTVATFRYRTEEAPKNYVFYRVDVSDLLGGHSGDDIDKGRVNSNKTVARLLWDGMQSYELKLAYFSGGNLRNAIPREAYAIFGIPTRATRRNSHRASASSPPIWRPNSASANPISASRSTKCPPWTACWTPRPSSDSSTRWWGFPTAWWPCRSPCRDWSRPRPTSPR